MPSRPAPSVTRYSRFLQSTFSRYIAPEVVSEMLKENLSMELGGEARVVTILFSDLKGFTTLSERMQASQVVEGIVET